MGISLQIDWKYLQRNGPVVSTLMGTIKEDLRETSFPVLVGGEEVAVDSRKILGHSIQRGCLGIPDPQS